MPGLKCCTQDNPSFPPFKLVLVAGSEIDMKNFTNPGLD